MPLPEFGELNKKNDALPLMAEQPPNRLLNAAWGNPPALKIEPELLVKHAIVTEHKEETMPEMTSRLLLSAGAGYVTRMAMINTIGRIPRVGPVASAVLPLAAAGMTSSYIKTGELTDLKSAGEGVMGYGILGGFRAAANDLVALRGVKVPIQTGFKPTWDRKATQLIPGRYPFLK